MHSSNKVLATILLGTTFGIAAVITNAGARPGPTYRQTATVQSASGQITAVQGNTFTLQISSTKNDIASSQSGPSDQKALTFTIDQDTDVDGKIAIGAQASVTYREQDGNNIAVSIRIVKQPS